MVHKADFDNQQYEISCMINLTSQDVAAYFPQFMYESVLRTATQDSDFKLEVETVPYPIIDLNE